MVSNRFITNFDRQYLTKLRQKFGGVFHWLTMYFA